MKLFTDIMTSLIFVEYKLTSHEVSEFNGLIDFISKNNFDCIQFELDSLAVIFYKLYVNSGHKVPEDLGLIGFDNIDATNFTNQTITSIDQRIDKQVDLALSNLFKIMKGEEASNNIMVKAKLIEKETV